MHADLGSPGMRFPHRPGAREPCAVGAGSGMVMSARGPDRDLESRAPEELRAAGAVVPGRTTSDFESVKPVVSNLFSQETLRREIALQLRGYKQRPWVHR